MELIKSNPSNYKISRVSSVSEFNGQIKDVSLSLINGNSTQASRATLDYATFLTLPNAIEALDNWKRRSVSFTPPKEKPKRSKKRQITDQDTPTKTSPPPSLKSRDKKKKSSGKKDGSDNDTEEDDKAINDAKFSDDESSKKNPPPKSHSPPLKDLTPLPTAMGTTSDSNSKPPLVELSSDEESNNEDIKT